MKVVFIVDTFPKLSETFILQQITGLIDSGLDVRIVAYSKGSKEEFQPEVEAYDLLSKLTLVPLTKNPLKLIRACVPFYAKRAFRLRGYQLFSKYNLLMLSYIPFLNKVPLEEEDVVVCNFGPNGIKAASLMRFGRKFKLITIFHGYDLSSFLRKEPRSIYADVFRYSSFVLPISEFWEKKLIELGCPSNKIAVHHMGIKLDKFDLQRERHDGFTFVSTGRLVDKKGFEYSIRAFAKALPNMHNNPRYVIIGDGPLRQQLQELVNSLGVAESVRLVGSRTSKEVVELLRAADVCIVPSVTASNGDMEGIPVVMLEAQAMGLPVIATDHSGLREGLIEGATGYIVKERDEADLADAITKASGLSEGELSSMGMDARKYITEHFNEDALKIELQKLVQQL